MKPTQRRTVALMYGISFLQGLCFYGPVATLYRTAVGVTVSQIALIESVNYLLCVALEVPLGAVCARLGYKKMLVLDCGLFFVSKLVFWRAAGFGAFLAERVILAFVMAGFSGCDDAYLYLAAGEQNAHRVLGNYSAVGTAGLVCASAVFTLCFAADYRAAALATVAAYGAAALLALALPEVPMQPEDSAPMAAQLRGIWRNLRANPRFGWVLSADVLLTVTGQTVTVFFSQLLYERCGIPVAVMGALYIAMTLAGLVSGASHRAARRLGGRFSAAVFALGAAGCLAAAFTRSPAVCVAGVFALQFAWRLWQPYCAKRKNDNVADGARAVVLSGYSMAENLAVSGLSLVLGTLADASLTGAMVLAGALCAAGLLCMQLGQRR